MTETITLEEGAAVFGVSKAAFFKWSTTARDFPAPVFKGPRGRHGATLFNRDEVLAWHARQPKKASGRLVLNRESRRTPPAKSNQKMVQRFLRGEFCPPCHKARFKFKAIVARHFQQTTRTIQHIRGEL